MLKVKTSKVYYKVKYEYGLGWHRYVPFRIEQSINPLQRHDWVVAPGCHLVLGCADKCRHQVRHATGKIIKVITRQPSDLLV